MRSRWILGLALLAGQAGAATIHVDQASGSDANDGASPVSAVATVTRGLQLAGTGDTIAIGPGTYAAASGETLPLVVPGAMTLRGAGAARTILDGALASQVMQVQPTAGPVVLRDLAVVRGMASIGGGVQFLDTAAVLVERCRFEGNDGAIGGGLEFQLDSVPSTDVVVRDSAFIRNVASIGGALQFQVNASGNHRLEVIRSRFSSNGGVGAGIRFQRNGSGTHTLVVDRSRFERSSGDVISAGPLADTLAGSVSSSLFAYNAGAAVAVGTAAVHVVNATMVGNAAGVVGGPGTRVDNSILWFNGDELVGSGGSVANSIVEGHDLDGHVDAGGVSAADPLLRSTFRPAAPSPAIDRGAHAPVAALGLALDLAGGPREVDLLGLGFPAGYVDIGAFEASTDLLFDDGFEAAPVPPT